MKKVLHREKYDLIIGDETYEFEIAMLLKLLTIKIPFVIIYDFFSFDAMTGNLSEKLGVYFWNFIWSQDRYVIRRGNNRALFVGELEDVPDKALGPFLPNRRRYASKYFQFLGYILPFDPAEYKDKTKIRKKLGYGTEP